jgi:hypothetical protein
VATPLVAHWVARGSTVAITAAMLVTTPVAHAEPCGADCGNPYFDPNDPTNSQFLTEVRAVGITGAPHGLISGARNRVCPDLDGGATADITRRRQSSSS